jgi:hypothetical protein
MLTTGKISEENLKYSTMTLLPCVKTGQVKTLSQSMKRDAFYSHAAWNAMGGKNRNIILFAIKHSHVKIKNVNKISNVLFTTITMTEETVNLMTKFQLIQE